MSSLALFAAWLGGVACGQAWAMFLRWLRDRDLYRG